METLILTQLSTLELRELIREEIREEFINFRQSIKCEEKQDDDALDEVGRGVSFAAQITKLKPSTIYGKVAQNKIPHSKQGNTLYFRRSELIEWLTK